MTVTATFLTNSTHGPRRCITHPCYGPACGAPATEDPEGAAASLAPEGLSVARPRGLTPTGRLLEAARPGARSSAGEHSLHTGGVTGSIPVAPTILSPVSRKIRLNSACHRMRRVPCVPGRPSSGRAAGREPAMPRLIWRSVSRQERGRKRGQDVRKSRDVDNSVAGICRQKVAAHRRCTRKDSTFRALARIFIVIKELKEDKNRVILFHSKGNVLNGAPGISGVADAAPSLGRSRQTCDEAPSRRKEPPS